MPHVRANGLDIFYREAGQGFPLVLIQGFEMDHRGWAYQVPALRQHFRCISLDNRDAGQSSKAPTSYTTLDMAQDVVGLLDALHIPQAHIVGHSMGGAIAQQVAIHYPQRVSKLVLISSFVFMTPYDRALMEMRRLLRARLSLEEYYRVTFPWIYSPQDYQNPSLIEETIRRAAANPNPMPLDAFFRQGEAILAHDTRRLLERITAPTLVVCGDQDLVTPLEQSRLLAQSIPSARLEILSGGGHGILWTRSDEVNRVLLDFLLHG
ncbi:MAG: alpha/beta hydrolase [Dehalococcoidia bacterium]|nr:alpha/beta hydrolase [Dehalococcoidia bacterium]MDW8119036.1 alpha/beta hydrolase [Chloroflexota bacterium]